MAVRSWALPPLRPTIDAALRDVGSKDAKYRAMAAESLGHAEPERQTEAREALVRLLGDEAVAVRTTAAFALGVLGGEASVEALVRAFDDPDPSVRLAVLDAVCSAESPSGADIATRAAKDSVVAVREAAPGALLQLLDDALEALVHLARDEAPGVRAAAAACLGACGEGAAPAVSELLEDAHEEVRIEAAFSAATLGERKALPILVALLGDRRLEREAAEALGRLGDPAAKAPLARVLARFFLSPWTRVAVAAALARIGDPAGAKELVRILSKKRWDAVALAAEEAAALGLSEARAPIEKLAARPPRALGAAPFEKALAALVGGS